MRYYDAIIALGERCSTAWALRDLSLQAETMPFDWNGNHDENKTGKGGLKGRVDLIENHFEKYFELEDLESRPLPPHMAESEHGVVTNRRTGLRYAHDFYKDQPLSENYQTVKEKYDRRVERFYRTMKISDRVMFVFLTLEEGYEDDYLVQQHRRLKGIFPNVRIDMLCLMQNCNFNPTDYEKINIADGLLKINGNFKYSEASDNVERLRGNMKLYFGILSQYCCPALFFGWQRAISQLRSEFKEMHFPNINHHFACIDNKLNEIASRIEGESKQ